MPIGKTAVFAKLKDSWESNITIFEMSLIVGVTHRHLSIIDCLSFVMCLLLAPLVIVFFSFFVAVVYSTNEANKPGGTCHLAIYFSSFDIYGVTTNKSITILYKTFKTLRETSSYNLSFFTIAKWSCNFVITKKLTPFMFLPIVFLGISILFTF